MRPLKLKIPFARTNEYRAPSRLMGETQAEFKKRIARDRHYWKAKRSEAGTSVKSMTIEEKQALLIQIKKLQQKLSKRK